MKSLIKKAIKFALPLQIRHSVWSIRQIYKKEGNFLRNLKKYSYVFPHPNNAIDLEFVNQMQKCFENVHFEFSDKFVYPYDPCVKRMLVSGYAPIASITPDYGKILKSNLAVIEAELSEVQDVNFKNIEMKMVSSIRYLCDRLIKTAHRFKEKDKNFFVSYLPLMLNQEPQTLQEALQKILFYNSMFWQAGHWHNGLGRLDKILLPYYMNDLVKHKLDKNGAKLLIKEFCLLLNRDIEAKSGFLKGDTGQYILLGGTDGNGDEIQNELTEIFLDVISDIHKPDPKLILRANNNTSTTIWQKSIDCISTGCGSPLIMNEAVVMKSMIDFGYRKEDVVDLGTSACWEPLIIGKSFDQNNPLDSVVAVRALNDILYNEHPKDFPTLLELFKKQLASEIKQVCRDLRTDVSPIFTLFFDDCIEEEKDFTRGGARYAFHGMQIVSFPNAINALLNIKKYVFEQKAFTFEECVNCIKQNFDGFEDMLLMFKNNTLQFGADDKVVLDLTNDLLNFIGQVAAQLTINGNKIKIGISSPNYIIQSSCMEATLDGRKNGEPFAVHISPISEKVGIKEILDFASRLDYSGNRINGNVVDFILPSAFLKDSKKLELILRDSISNGIFELQLNVLNVDILRDAKIHPENHKDLIVRVWGFSAYFNDLPESYKDYLIKRAETYAA